MAGISVDFNRDATNDIIHVQKPERLYAWTDPNAQTETLYGWSQPTIEGARYAWTWTESSNTGHYHTGSYTIYTTTDNPASNSEAMFDKDGTESTIHDGLSVLNNENNTNVYAINSGVISSTYIDFYAYVVSSGGGGSATEK